MVATFLGREAFQELESDANSGVDMEVSEKWKNKHIGCKQNSNHVQILKNQMMDQMLCPTFVGSVWHYYQSVQFILTELCSLEVFFFYIYKHVIKVTRLGSL